MLPPLFADLGQCFFQVAYPFPDAPARWIRVEVYEYRFAPLSSEAVWEREWVGELIPAIGADDPRLLDYLRERGAPVAIALPRRIKVAFEWTLKRYLQLLALALVGSLLVLVTDKLLRRLGAFRAMWDALLDGPSHGGRDVS